MRTFKNDRSQQTVQTELSNDDIVRQFGKVAPKDSWLWFWLVKTISQYKEPDEKTADMMAFLGDSFLLAIGMGLKRPMIRLNFNDYRFKIYLSKFGTVCFKAGALVPGTSDPTGDEEYVGCIRRGNFIQSDRRQMTEVDKAFLQNLTEDPVKFMAKCSKDMDRCCYCNLPLEDARSKDVGYGAICAGRWGLPWGKTYDEKVPSFAQLWAKSSSTDRNSIRGTCIAIRENPKDELSWNLLGDALEDAGYLKRPHMPTTKVVMPAV